MKIMTDFACTGKRRPESTLEETAHVGVLERSSDKAEWESLWVLGKLHRGQKNKREGDEDKPYLECFATTWSTPTRFRLSRLYLSSSMRFWAAEK